MFYNCHFQAASSFACLSAIERASIICPSFHIIICGIQEKFCQIL